MDDGNATKRARLIARLDTIKKGKRKDWAREMEIIADLEAHLGTPATDPSQADLFRRVSAVIGFDLTSREAIQRRRAELEQQLGRS